MKVTCSGCGRSYNVDDEKIPEGRRIETPCPGCKTPIVVVKRGVDAQCKEAAHGLPDHGEALLRKIVRESRALPPMPEVMGRAITVLADETCGFNEIGEVIKTDQALATRVLKIANSAYYSLSVPVSTVKQAAAIMGCQAISDLITVVSTSKMLGKNLSGYRLSSRQIWEHSLACAYTSRLIAEAKAPSLANDAFNAGLIHDSGLLMLDPFIGMLKPAFDEAMKQDGTTFCDAEKELFGFTHAEVAGLFFQKWNLPKVQTEAIRFQHTPEEGNSPLAHIIHVADVIAMGIMESPDPTGAHSRTNPVSVQELALSPEEMEEIGARAKGAVASVTQSLD
ncbi:HDOD domain-containing protein [Desulfoluna spongiiphila]|uniref:HD-like signal output (HDOD) domain, no enzymatic activity n=1 Tax=Desulfoluna spongiiphila TaxID=419481 RepID=A0A1G5G856_9BACT|nr:HDOD domain-containing protein [Desulfoluna spongiiphila]SCY47806.1 HD-like signal output (HDOD) domain, no enzymatic activity [Desulfoluna spongiiphila]VVS93716.1 metal-dependent hydrolase hdod [Desulfoluna spongiiphila]